MAYRHNRNKYKRSSFSIGTETNESTGEKFKVYVSRAKKFREYTPGAKSIGRIQSIIDSGLFNTRVRIEVDRQARQMDFEVFYDYIDIEIS